MREDVDILKRAILDGFLREGDPVSVHPFIEAESRAATMSNALRRSQAGSRHEPGEHAVEFIADGQFRQVRRSGSRPGPCRGSSRADRLPNTPVTNGARSRLPRRASRLTSPGLGRSSRRDRSATFRTSARTPDQSLRDRLADFRTACLAAGPCTRRRPDRIAGTQGRRSARFAGHRPVSRRNPAITGPQPPRRWHDVHHPGRCRRPARVRTGIDARTLLHRVAGRRPQLLASGIAIRMPECVGHPASVALHQPFVSSFRRTRSWSCRCGDALESGR